MILTDFIEMLRAAADKTGGQQFMSNEQLKQLFDAMAEGDPKAKRIVENLVLQSAGRGVTGEFLVALLAGLHSIGFRGQALIQAFEANDYSFDRTWSRGIFALIRSEFPFIQDPFTPESEAAATPPRKK